MGSITRRLAVGGIAASCAAILTRRAAAETAPEAIRIGHLYAASGPFAAISMPVYYGMKFWAEALNRTGGALVKPFGRKIPIKLIAYDDQSSTGTAATLYNQLITQDKVDILVADSGSVLTSVAVPIAREHKQLLFDPTGTGAAFFTADNPYIVLLSNPVSSIWPRYIPEFLASEGVKAGIKRVALLYCTNDFTGTQAAAIRRMIKAGKSPLEIVYDQGVPTSTSNYSVLISNIAAANPDAVIELGYPGNDIAFLRNLQDSGSKFRFVFAVYPGLETEVLMQNVGAAGLRGIFTYVAWADLDYKPNFGMTLAEYHDAWKRAYPGGKVDFGSNAVNGYNAALVIERALATTASMAQLDLRAAVFAQSGKLRTLEGLFELAPSGAQIGEITPLGQFSPEGSGAVKLRPVYPADVAVAKADLGPP